MAESLEQALHRHRDEEKETDAGDHGEGKEAIAQETPDPAAGLCFHAPDGVERVLQLAENAACSEECEGHADNRGPDALVLLRSFLRDPLDDIDRAAIEEIPELSGHLFPCSRRIVAEDKAKDGEEDENERSE